MRIEKINADRILPPEAERTASNIGQKACKFGQVAITDLLPCRVED
jgi:hypothetical protein